MTQDEIADMAICGRGISTASDEDRAECEGIVLERRFLIVADVALIEVEVHRLGLARGFRRRGVHALAALALLTRGARLARATPTSDVRALEARAFVALLARGASTRALRALFALAVLADLAGRAGLVGAALHIRHADVAVALLARGTRELRRALGPAAVVAATLIYQEDADETENC